MRDTMATRLVQHFGYAFWGKNSNCKIRKLELIQCTGPVLVFATLSLKPQLLKELDRLDSLMLDSDHLHELHQVDEMSLQNILK